LPKSSDGNQGAITSDSPLLTSWLMDWAVAQASDALSVLE